MVAWGLLSEEDGALPCPAAPNAQTCLASSQLLNALLSDRPYQKVTWGPKGPGLPEGASGASGCVGATARACSRLLPLYYVPRWRYPVNPRVSRNHQLQYFFTALMSSITTISNAIHHAASAAHQRDGRLVASRWERAPSRRAVLRAKKATKVTKQREESQPGL